MSPACSQNCLCFLWEGAWLSEQEHLLTLRTLTRLASRFLVKRLSTVNCLCCCNSVEGEGQLWGWPGGGSRADPSNRTVLQYSKRRQSPSHPPEALSHPSVWTVSPQKEDIWGKMRKACYGLTLNRNNRTGRWTRIPCMAGVCQAISVPVVTWEACPQAVTR